MKVIKIDLNLKVLLTEYMIIIIILNNHFKSPFAFKR